MVLRPGSVAEVSAILKLANETHTPIVPQGGNTGLVGGQVPSAAGNEIVLSLSRLNRVRAVDRDSNTMIAEAGVTLAEARAAADAVDRLFPAVDRRGRLVRDRRQPLHQCRRHRRARLRQHARAGAGRRGGARLRRGVGRPEDAAQGQYRLRPQAPVHRRGRHARRGHRRGADAGAEAPRRRRRLHRARRPGDGAQAVPPCPQPRRQEPHRLRDHPAGRPRIRAASCAGHARSAGLVAPVVRADGVFLGAIAGGRRRGSRGDLRRRSRRGAGRRRCAGSVAGAGDGLLAPARDDVGGAEAGGRLDQARRRGAAGAGAGTDRAGLGGSGGDRFRASDPAPSATWATATSI